jgi:hypothetical protein
MSDSSVDSSSYYTGTVIYSDETSIQSKDGSGSLSVKEQDSVSQTSLSQASKLPPIIVDSISSDHSINDQDPVSERSGKSVTSKPSISSPNPDLDHLPRDKSLSRLRNNLAMVKSLTPRSHQNAESLSDIMPSNLVQGIATAKVSPSSIAHAHAQKESPFVSPKFSRGQPSARGKATPSMMSPKISRPYTTLDKLYQELERGLALQVTQTKKMLNLALDKLDNRIRVAEGNLKQMYGTLIMNCNQELNVADQLVQKELRSKILTSQWTSTFLVNSETQLLDPISFAYARFSLNICLSYCDVEPQYFIQSKVRSSYLS